MPRKKPRPEPIDGELVIVPPSPADPLPPEMPSYDVPPDPVDVPPSDTPPEGGWKALAVGVQASTETMRAIQEAFPPDRVVAMMEQMATATMETKSGILRPDYRAREQVIKIMLSYNLGLPVPQVQAPPAPPRETDDEGMRRILQSPAARRVLADMIRKAEKEGDRDIAPKDS